MRFFHLSDLHIGKRVNDFSMIEDQRYILGKILAEIDIYKPDAVLIAGDVYDKTVPTAEAVKVLDEFLYELVKRKLVVIMISGNHDSPERLAFGANIMKNQNVYISPVFDNNLQPIMLTDEFGEIAVYMLPYIKPIHVKKYYPDVEISTYNDAIKTVIDNIELDKSVRNIILAHQFITSAVVSESEEIFVGTIENISSEIFDDFDYVALGHLHRPQKVKRDTLRYAGSPLKYSFSEVNNKKSITYFDMLDKSSPIEVKTIPLVPIRDMKEITGRYDELVSKNYYADLNLDDYYHITLTDEHDIPNALSKLRSVYKNIMKLDYDNKRTSQNIAIKKVADIEKKSPLEIVAEFYQKQNNDELNSQQIEYLDKVIEKVWSGKDETN